MTLKRLISSIFKRQETENKQAALKSRLDYAMSQSLVRHANSISDSPKDQSESSDE